MPLDRGTRLGPYQIESPLGAGGMGEVYKATDTRLERTVAIKVLPAHVASDPERKQRFEREAKVISGLNHPHICTLYEFDNHEGTDFLVMEYLEGETLADRLAKGALPLDQALKYAIEIADALDKAHRQGVTHRDLKPANIMLTKAGAKLLDFGLAKLKPTGPQSDASTKLADALTEQGTILGTFQYMAPEQLEGQDADARSDIWAFGCVVYEMVTGQKAFEGTSQASLITAIMRSEPPPPSSVESMSPAALDYALQTCLAKDPDDRWQSVRDLERELERVGSAGTRPDEPTMLAQRAFWQRPLVLVTTVLIAVALGFALRGAATPERPLPQSAVRFSIDLPEGQRFNFDNHSQVAISPDGSQLVYVSSGQLHTRPLDRRESRPISGTDGAANPFFSPDGRWVAFYAGQELLKVALDSDDAPVSITGGVERLFRGSWTANGRILLGSPDGIMQVSSDGGTPELLLSTEGSGFLPQLLPGGESVSYGDSTSWSVGSIDTGHKTPLDSVAGLATYLPTGHIVYEVEERLLAVPFDLDSLEVTGSPVPLLENVLSFAIAENGTLAYVPSANVGDRRRLVWVDRQGSVTPAVEEPQVFRSPHLSPDGGRLAVEILGNAPRSDLWIYDLRRGTRVRLTLGEMTYANAVWSRDGSQITFRESLSGQPSSLYSSAADGGEDAQLLYRWNFVTVPRSWSPDGKLLALSRDSARGAPADIFILHTDTDQELEPFLISSANEVTPSFSPDGQYIAYVSDESGRNEVYVQPYPGPGGRWVISTEGGHDPVWSQDGSELFYRNEDQMVVVAVETEQGFTPGPPGVLFDGGGFTQALGRQSYDVSPDGERFLMVEPVESSSQIHVVLNWTSELERLVPTP